MIVPITRDPETFGHQNGISPCIRLRQGVLTAIDFDDDALFETDEVENKALKGDLATKFEKRKPPIAEQRHMAASASVGSRRILFAKLRMRLAVGRWCGVCGTNPSPGAFGATLSHKGRGKILGPVTVSYTRIGIGT